MNDPEAEDAAFQELRECMQFSKTLIFPIEQIEAALDRMGEMACSDTGGSQAARGFLYSMAGEKNSVDGEDYRWDIMELRRFDYSFQRDAIMLIQWMIGPEGVMDMIREQISRFEKSWAKR